MVDVDDGSGGIGMAASSRIAANGYNPTEWEQELQPESML